MVPSFSQLVILFCSLMINYLVNRTANTRERDLTPCKTSFYFSGVDNYWTKLEGKLLWKTAELGVSFCQTDGLCRMWNLKRHFLEISMKITVLGEYCNCFLVQLDKMVLRFYLCIQLLPQSLVVWIQDLHMPIVSMIEILGKFWHCVFVTNISLGWCYMKQT